MGFPRRRCRSESVEPTPELADLALRCAYLLGKFYEHILRALNSILRVLPLDLSAACDISSFFSSHGGAAANRSSLSLSAPRKSLATSLQRISGLFSVPLLVSTHLTETILCPDASVLDISSVLFSNAVP